MRPIPIPDDDVWEGGRRVAVGPPTMEDIDALFTVDAVIDIVKLQHGEDLMEAPRYNMKIVLETGDLEALAKDPHFWLSIITTRLTPFNVGILPEGVKRLA